MQIPTSLSIIVADFDAGTRLMVTGWLESAGHAVIGVATGNEAIRAVRHNRVDVVLTEVIMPDGDGLELMAELKRLRHDTPVIAFSAGGRVLPAVDCLVIARKLGAYRVLTKPLCRELILSTIASIVSERWPGNEIPSGRGG